MGAPKKPQSISNPRPPEEEPAGQRRRNQPPNGAGPTQTYTEPHSQRSTQTPGCWPSTHHRGQHETKAGASYNVQYNINPVNLLHVSSNSSHLDVHRSCMLHGCASSPVSELFKAFRYGLAMLNKILVISKFVCFFKCILERVWRVT